MDKMDHSPFWEYLTEEERAYHKRFMACATIEEFKKKFDLIDIKDLKGKYGF